MLSIQAMGHGQENYYTNLAREDYYVNGGEPPGRWWGSGAEKLGLTDRVEKSELKALFRGSSPDGEALVQNAGKEDRQPGWDLTFSAPKSVSVLWSVADEATRQAIQQAHHEAVQSALTVLEREHAYTRRGKGGSSREPAGLVVATFEHSTSRALDPDLHTHSLVMNVGTRDDGGTGSLLSRPFFKAKLAVGAAYRTDFAARLTRLGFECKPDREFFAVVGVSEDLCRHQSKRRAAIEKELGSAGLESASAAAFAARKTRSRKAIVPPRQELFARWREEAKPFGFTPEVAARLRRSHSSPDIQKQQIDRVQPVAAHAPLSTPAPLAQTNSPRRAFHIAIRTITETHAHFSEADVIRETERALRVIDTDVSASVRKMLSDSSYIKAVGEREGRMRYTTKHMLHLEAKLLRDVDSSKNHKWHILPRRHVDAAIKKYAKPRSTIVEEAKYHLDQFKKAARGEKTGRINRSKLAAQSQTTLSAEQEAAVRHLTQTPGSVKVLTGPPGAAKTSTLRVCREAWEKSGYTVIGIAAATRTARRLAEGSGIQSESLAMFLARMYPSLKYRLRHFSVQAIRATFLGKPMWSLDTLKLNERTVLVVDDAGTIGTRQMALLTRTAKKAGALLVLVANPQQVQSLRAGGPIPAIARVVGQSELRTVVRQESQADRQVVHAIHEGRSDEALADLARRGRYIIAATRNDAMNRLASGWTLREGKNPSQAVILCGSRANVQTMNRICQEHRLAAQFIHRDKRITLHKGHVHVGDRVVLRQNAPKLGVQSGTTGTVLGLDPILRHMTVRTDEGERIVLPLRSYKIRHGDRKGQVAVDLAYASTAQSTQAAEVQRAYVLVGGKFQDKELAAVQVSRHVKDIRIYTDSFHAATLARDMATSRAKDLAHDVIRENESRRQQMERTR